MFSFASQFRKLSESVICLNGPSFFFDNYYYISQSYKEILKII